MRGFAPTGVHVLPNGMRVLTRELRHAPVGSVMVWYGVGSRNERPGATGISHFLEHMMFKGTPRFPYGALEEGVKRRGGMWNAFTSYDYTAYYEVLPAAHLEYGLEIEADRMVNMTFDPELTVRERGIIVSEREGHENRPNTWLFEAFMQEAFREFPYRHSVIGYKDDIKATTAEVLTDHYRRYYRPANATLVAVGDFDTDRMLEMAERHFGHLPPGEGVAKLTAEEPPQTAERRLEVRRHAPNPSLTAGYKIPPADHADLAALSILGAVLSGGAGGMGRSSRFYRRLVSKGIAAGAAAGPWGLQYGGLFLCQGSPVPGVSPDALEAALFAEVEALRQEKIPQDELDRAKKQVRAQFIYGMETAMNQARMLGATALTQGVEQFDGTLEEYAAVTADDVLRVAQLYLAPERRTVGWLIPEAEKAAAPASKPAAEDGEPPAGAPDFQKPGNAASEQPVRATRAPILDQGRVVRRTLPGGATLLVYPADTVPSLFLRVQVEAGPAHDPAGKEGLANLTAQLLTRGSAAFTGDELALQTDSLGISIRVEVGRETSVGTLKCLPEDMETGLALIAEVLRRPTFPADELDRLRRRLIVSVREAENDTRAMAARRLAETIYPEGHPYRAPTQGTEESLGAIAVEDLQAFHNRHYGSAGAIITAVGNVDPAALEAALLKAFDGWNPGGGRAEVPPAAPPTTATEIHVTLPGKSQMDVALGWPLVDRRHPDFLALEFLATLFGGNGTPASSRLFRDVREKYGLSYYQFAHFSAQLGPAAWTTHIGVHPSRVAFAKDVLRAELRKLAETDPPAEELDALKDFLESYPAVQHESPERVASRLAELERFGLGLDYLDRYPHLVRGLTARDLREAAARHLDLDRLTLITAGPEPGPAE